MRRRVAARVISILSLSISIGVFAQENTVDRFQRQLDQLRLQNREQAGDALPFNQRALFDYGMIASLSYLSLDDPSLHNTAFRQYELTAYTRLNVDRNNEFFFRGHLFNRDFNTGDRFSSEGENVDGRIDRLYYKLGLSGLLSHTNASPADGQISIKLGRDLVTWGTGLTLSQELDGATIDFDYKSVSLQLLAGTTPIDTVDFDGSRPNFDSDTHRAFFGGLLTSRVGAHRPFAYFLSQRDNNPDATGTTTISDTAIQTATDYNSWYIGIGSNGALSDKLLYGVEFTYEGGDTLSNSFTVTDGQNPQSRDSIQAWAFDLQLDYVPTDRHNSRLSGEVVLASGDSNRFDGSNTLGGNAPNTKDHGFNAFGLVNVGVAFAPSVSNLAAFRIGVSTYPLPDVKCLRHLQIGTDLFAFCKLSREGGVDEATTNDHFLGTEPDVYLNWQLTSELALTARYGIFIPGDAIEADGKMRQFLYAGVSFAF